MLLPLELLFLPVSPTLCSGRNIQSLHMLTTFFTFSIAVFLFQ